MGGGGSPRWEQMRTGGSLLPLWTFTNVCAHIFSKWKFYMLFISYACRLEICSGNASWSHVMFSTALAIRQNNHDTLLSLLLLWRGFVSFEKEHSPHMQCCQKAVFWILINTTQKQTEGKAMALSSTGSTESLGETYSVQGILGLQEFITACERQGTRQAQLPCCTNLRSIQDH